MARQQADSERSPTDDGAGGDAAANDRATPLCWRQTTNLPDNYYAVARDRDIVFNGDSSARLYSADGRALFGTLQQFIDASAYAGKRIELSAVLKHEIVDGPGITLWLHAVDAQGMMLANVRSAHVPGSLPWHSRGIVMDLPNEAAALRIAFSLSMSGTVWIDDVRLAVLGEADLSAYDPGAFKGVAPVPDVASLAQQPCNLDFELWED